MKYIDERTKILSNFEGHEMVANGNASDMSRYYVYRLINEHGYHSFHGIMFAGKSSKAHKVLYGIEEYAIDFCRRWMAERQAKLDAKTHLTIGRSFLGSGPTVAEQWAEMQERIKSTKETT